MPTVRFHAHGKTWDADVPIGESILSGAKAVDAPEGDACGGVCGCSTCHVYVKEGLGLLSPAEEDEEDIMDKAFDVRAISRLGCQAKLVADGHVEVDIARESLDAYYNEHPKAVDPRKAKR
jgi:2Fe-2S ferredoxin